MTKHEQHKPSWWRLSAANQRMNKAFHLVCFGDSITQCIGYSEIFRIPKAVTYQGQRFDGAAMVSEATWNGHRFFTRFKADETLMRHEGAGTAEEFDLKSSAGYLPAALGGGFS